MNGTTVEAKDTKCAGAPPSRDGENLVERSGLAGEGEHSHDEDPADGALSTLSGDAEMVRAEVVAGVTEAGLVLKPQVEEDRSESAVENAPSLDRLFTSEELDLLMEGETLGVSEEREEYEKEHEERLYPLDEVELKLRMEKNAEQQQELSLEEIDSILNIPAETLARTRESSPGELSTPEYWLSWYKKTLAVTEEARRANRNLQGAEPAGGKTDRVGAVSLTASDGRDVGGGDVIGDELLQTGCDPVPVHGEVDKSVVRGNILICMKERSEAFPDREPGRPEVDDLYGYVYSVSDGDGTRRRRKPGLVEVSDAESDDDEEPSFLRDGKKVIGSVGDVEAVLAGYIDCTPVETLIDTGTIASLVNSRVLKRVGRADTPLRPSNKDLYGVTGHKLRIRGEIDLPLRVGSLEVMRPFVVVDRLHVDTILGTDTLKELRAVIDLEENKLTLKGTGEVFPLGAPRVEEMHSTRIRSTVRLRPGGQALVVTDVQGNAPKDATVLIEGLQEVDATVRVARTLCTAHGGKVLVEVCNASEEVIISKGTLLGAVTVVPEIAFASSAGTDGDKTPASEESGTKPEGNPSWIDSILSAAAWMRPQVKARCLNWRRYPRKSWTSTSPTQS
ncbi:hypothetical protein PR001_g20797 [Phytophthora rubi]|uniref:Peptidase A2 domain-containing protein n=1 Tax=Phytophthora rubi TaxID=129364 RepID=A0A6A3JKL6_9STRA|nr:hypothetical protein PR001_g20797 [Phytophthora rubi]